MRVNFAAPAAAAIEVSQSLAGHAAVRAEVLRRAGLTALVIAVASAFVTSLLGLVLVGRPLAELVAQARRIGEGDLSYRIATRRRDEVAELGHEMNRMCERLRDARESERAEAEAKMHALAQLRHADRLATVGRLAAGLAHELGTPLNVVQARARQMAGGTLGPAEVSDKSRIIVEQVVADDEAHSSAARLRAQGGAAADGRRCPRARRPRGGAARAHRAKARGVAGGDGRQQSRCEVISTRNR